MNLEPGWWLNILSLEGIVLLCILLTVMIFVVHHQLNTPPISDTPVDDSLNSNRDWYSKSIKFVLELLNTTEEGISNEEASERLNQVGPNQLPAFKQKGSLMRFLAQFHNVLIYVLIVAGIVTATLGHWVDASVILGVVIINSIIGFVQEGKAENALKAIRDML